MDDKLQYDDNMPILLKATVQNAATGETRAATTSTTQDTEFLTNERVDAYIFCDDETTPVDAGSNPGTNPLQLKVTNSNGDLEPYNNTEPLHYYPADGKIKIYAVHPSVGSTDAFSVETDQTTDDNYAKSDLCYCPMIGKSRSNVSHELIFKHVLSKIVINVTTNIAGATLPTTAKIMANKTTAMTYPINSTPYYSLAAASDPATITMGLTTDGSKVSGGVVIPPQIIAAETSFISFSVPGVGPLVYPLPAATTFESGMRYTYDIKVDEVGITVTTNVDSWGTEAPQTVIGKINRPILPIEYAAQTNMYNATTFSSNNKKNTSCFMNWDTAYGYYNSTNGTQRNLTGQTCIGKSSSSWHLPTFAEVSALIPSPNLSTGDAYVFFNATNLLYSSGETLEWGWNGGTYNVSGTFYSEYKNVSQKYAYAVRYKDSNTAKGGYGVYTTAFRYELRTNYPESGDESLIIRWKWLGEFSSDILSDSSDDVIGNESYWTTYDGECVIPRVGFYIGNANAGTTPSGENAHYWTSTAKDGSNKYLFYYNDNRIGDEGTYYSTRDKTYGFTVRLFADAQ